MGLSASRRPVVLIVEDEFLLRMDAADMIAGAGFEVVEASNADRAIEILEAGPTSAWFSPISRYRVPWMD
jgi:CheY-like chemotaxis protein